MRWGWLVLALTLPVVAKETMYRIHSTDGWLVIDAAGKRSPAHISANSAGLRYDYDRGRSTLLQYDLPVQSFTKVQIEVKSKVPMTLGVGLQDKGGAKYHAAANLSAGQWCMLTFTPTDFKLNHDSPVKKPLTPPDLENKVWFVDGAVFSGESGTNRLDIRQVKVLRP